MKFHVEHAYPAVTLHNHTEDQPCGGAAGGCSEYPAGEQIITLYDEPTDAERRSTWFNLPEGGPW